MKTQNSSGAGRRADALGMIVGASFERLILRRISTMNFIEKSKWLYSAGKAFVSRNLFVTLVVIVVMLQAIIWLAVRSLEDTHLFYRCGSHDYPCRVVIQPEPKL